MLTSPAFFQSPQEAGWQTGKARGPKLPSFLPISEAVPGPESPILSAGVSLCPIPHAVADLPNSIPTRSRRSPSSLLLSLSFHLPSFFLFCQIILVPSDPWHSFSQSPPERGDATLEMIPRLEICLPAPPPPKLLCSIAASFPSLCSSAFALILLAYWHFKKPFPIGICSQ